MPESPGQEEREALLAELEQRAGIKLSLEDQMNLSDTQKARLLAELEDEERREHAA